MACCKTGEKLKEEYDNALKFEALSYGRLIAHKRRHGRVKGYPIMQHLHMVNEVAKRYAEGDVETFEDIPST